MPPWDKYQDRYKARPETFDAYVDVWTRLPETQASFGGWVGFAQATSAEPSWVAKHPERVRVAEELMRKAGYEIGGPTEKGAAALGHRGTSPEDRDASPVGAQDLGVALTLAPASTAVRSGDSK